MTACAAVAERNGEEETAPEKSLQSDLGAREEGMDENNVVTALVQILGSADPETAFLGALETGAIPDEVCLELAEHLGELARPALAGRGGVKVVDFDNRLEVVAALRENGTISEKTQEVLLLAILEMDEQEEVPIEAETVLSIPEPTPQSDFIAAGQASESPTAAPQAPSTNLIADLIRSVAELQAQFSTAAAVPEEKLSEIRQSVGKLTEEEFASPRQTLGSAILAQAEVSADQRQIDVSASLEVIGILLDPRQAELTRACFSAYEILVREGFRLTHRNGYDRPLMTVASIKLLRNRFRGWLDSRESGLGKEELASAQNAVATLEGFLLAAADDYTKAAIRREQAIQLRKRILSSWVRVLDAVNEELVAALPQTKEEALRQIQGYLYAKRAELASELRAAGSAILGEAEATIRQIFDLRSACAALRREMAELKASDYDPLSQRPVLTGTEKRLAFFESERPDLIFDYFELAEVLKSPELRGNERKKTVRQLGEVAGKLEELDQLIAGLRPAPALEVRHG